MYLHNDKELFGYIAYEKQAPENVQEQIAKIKTAVLGLNKLPQSHQDRLVGRYAGKWYKQLLVDNYVAIFRIDETCLSKLHTQVNTPPFFLLFF